MTRPGAAPAPRVLVDRRSDVQHIRLAVLPGAGLSLLLDGAWQFTEATEHRYHEALIVVPLTRARPARVLIGGGGDGLAAARLLRYPHVERVVVCDFDADVLALARTEPALVALNEGALNDPRVHVVREDLVRWLAETDDLYDLVVFDLPDGVSPELARLYSVEVFQAARARLVPGGLFVTQTCISGRAPAIIGNTLREVFGHARFYRLPTGNGTVAGFTLASDAPLDRRGEVPAWTRHFTTDLADAVFAVGKDELPPSDEVNRLGDLALYREIGQRVPAQRWSRPYPYNRACRVVNVGPRGLAPLPAVLDALERDVDVLVYVDERADGVGEGLAARGYTWIKRYAAVEMTWDAHGEAALARAEAETAGLVARVDAFRGRADAFPEVLRLVEAYVDVAADRAFDAVVNYGFTEQEALWLVARDADGAAVALWKVNDQHDPPDAEFFYGLGPRARNKAALVAFLRYVERHVGPAITGMVPVPKLVETLVSVGLRLRLHVDVWRKERA